MVHARLLARAAFTLTLIATAAPIVAIGAPAFAQEARGHASADAEAFVQTEANRVVGVFSDGRLNDVQRRQTFRRMIDQVADIPRITDFVLGRYRRSASPGQYARFARAFRNYAYSIYETRLNSYAGQKLQVIGSVERRPGDVIVSSRVVGPTNGRSPDVQWRLLRDGGGRWKAVDVNVRGIWLAITEQQDFASTLGNNGGDVDALSAQLERARTGR